MIASLSPSSGEVLVVMYHYVRDTERTAYPALKALRISEFDAQLEWLASEWRPVDYTRFEAALTGAGPLPERPALLTFDDGFVDHYEAVFPRLRARQWTGVFFVAGAALDDPPRLLNVHKTHFLLAELGVETFSAAVQDSLTEIYGGRGLRHRPEVYRYDQSPDLATKHLLNYELPLDEAERLLSLLFERHIGDQVDFARTLYLSKAMMREMARAGMTFGFHTERHPVLSRLEASAQRIEVDRGVAMLREITGHANIPFCYPYGHPHTYNADTIAALGQAGYGSAFNTTRRFARPGTDPRFELPRFDTRDLPPFSTP